MISRYDIIIISINVTTAMPAKFQTKTIGTYLIAKEKQKCVVFVYNYARPSNRDGDTIIHAYISLTSLQANNASASFLVGWEIPVKHEGQL